MTSAEIQLNPALEAAGVSVFETDLAELIIQLGDDEPSHIVVPALHVNRAQVREIFARRMGLKDLTDDPQALTAAARTYLRQKFLTIPTAISGANFLIAETGSVVVVESEGNGRMCLTLPRTLITVAGIEKVIPRFQDLEVMLQVLARSATGERMNPYSSLWTGVTPWDGPQRFHGKRCGPSQGVTPVQSEL
jgi:L-lactate dehydrogenase complex protein LldF